MKQTKKQALMKHFSSVLRAGAKSPETQLNKVSSSLAKYLSRKEIVEIINGIYTDVSRKHNLALLENEELLELIDNEMHLISYFTTLWSKENTSGFKGEKKSSPVKKSNATKKS